MNFNPELSEKLHKMGIEAARQVLSEVYPEWQAVA